MITIEKRNQPLFIAKIAVNIFILFCLLLELIILWYPSDNPLKILIMIVPIMGFFMIYIMFKSFLKDLKKSDVYIVTLNGMEYEFKDREKASKFYCDLIYDIYWNLNLSLI